MGAGGFRRVGSRILHDTMEQVKKEYVESVLASLDAPAEILDYVEKYIRADNSMFFHAYTADIRGEEKLATMALEVFVKAWDGLFDFYSGVKRGFMSDDSHTFSPTTLAWSTAALLASSRSYGLPTLKDLLELYAPLYGIVLAERKLAKGWPGVEEMYSHYYTITEVTRKWLRRLGLPAEAWKRTALLLLYNNVSQAVRNLAGVYTKPFLEAPFEEIIALAKRLLFCQEDAVVLDWIKEAAKELKEKQKKKKSILNVWRWRVSGVVD